MKTIIEMSLRNIIPNKLLSTFIENTSEQDILDLTYFYEKQKDNLTSDHFLSMVQDIVPNLKYIKKTMQLYSDQAMDKLEETQKETQKRKMYISSISKKENESITPKPRKKDIMKIVVPKDIHTIPEPVKDTIETHSPKKLIDSVSNKVQKRKKIWTREDEERSNKRMYHKNIDIVNRIDNSDTVENTLYKTKMCNWLHNCTNRKCQYAHAEEERRCVHFSTSGKCRFGTYCYRVHDTL